MVAIVPSKHMPSFTGALIDNCRLQLLEKLGSGAYGDVYRARDLYDSYGKPFYAIKCLHMPPVDSKAYKLLSRELDLQHKVSGHPNILSLVGVTQDDYFVYIMLDVCSGGDLYSAIVVRDVYYGNVELIRSAYLQLIDAVEHCHKNHIYHRDLKPENILTSEDGTHIWLADFGLATSDAITKEFGCGSGFYMSPECIGEELQFARYSTARSDIWSLGVVLINMVTGRNPWKHALSGDECFSAYLHDNDYLRSVLPISHEVSEILKRIFVMNPLQRISLSELRQEIQKIDTFYMSPHELAQASDFVRATARQYAKPVSFADLPSSYSDLRSPSTSSMSSVNSEIETMEVDALGMDMSSSAHSEEVYVCPHPQERSHPIDRVISGFSEETYAYPSPDGWFPVLKRDHSRERINSAAYRLSTHVKPTNPEMHGYSTSASACSLDHHDHDLAFDSQREARDSSVRVSQVISLESVDESEGPITPETYPVDPAIAIPDLEDGEDLGNSILELPPRPAFKKSPSTFRKKLSKVVGRLQRIL